MSFPPNYPPPPRDDFGRPPFQEAPPNYLWQAIVITVLGVLCCPVGLVGTGFGIAALVNSSTIAEKQRNGDIEGAMAASLRVKKFCIVGACVLAGAVILNIIYYFAVA